MTKQSEKSIRKAHRAQILVAKMVLLMRLVYCLLLISAVTGRKAIVTLLSGSAGEAERYVRLLHFFVYSLRNAGYDGEIAVMYATDFPVNTVKLAQLLNVRMIPVEKITMHQGPKGNSHYASMLTKLHLWSLTEYEQIIYYDCDFIFQGNPASAFNQCLWSSLCATPDTGISDFNKAIRPGTYFNGGFLVIRPNKVQYKFLLDNKHHAQGKFFVEQDLLNQLYKNSWGKLDQSYNLMHCYRQKKIASSVIAIHEKMWILRKSFPEAHYIWNSGKMQINYPISDVLTPNNMAQQVQSENAPTMVHKQPNKPNRPIGIVRNPGAFTGRYSVLRQSNGTVHLVQPTAPSAGTNTVISGAAPNSVITGTADAAIQPTDRTAHKVRTHDTRHSEVFRDSINRAPMVRSNRGYTKKGRSSLRARSSSTNPALQATIVQYKSQEVDRAAAALAANAEAFVGGDQVRNTLVYTNNAVSNGAVVAVGDKQQDPLEAAQAVSVVRPAPIRKPALRLNGAFQNT